MTETEQELDCIVTPFPERIGAPLKLPYSAAWMILFSLLLSFRLFTVFSNGEPTISIIPCAGFAFLPCALGVLIVIYSKWLEQFSPQMRNLLDMPADEAKQWMEGQICAIFNDKWMIASGVALTAVYIPTVMQGGFYPEATSSRIAFLLTMAAMSFMGGAMLTVMTRITGMLWQLGRGKPLKISLFPHPQISINTVGGLLAKISTSLMGVYFLTVLSMTPVTIDFLTMMITVLFAGVVALFFIIPQIKIHQIMVMNKYNKVALMSDLVEQALDELKREKSKDTIRHIQQLFDIQKSLNEVREWPFNLQLLLSVIGSIIVPLLVCAATFYAR